MLMAWLGLSLRIRNLLSQKIEVDHVAVVADAPDLDAFFRPADLEAAEFLGAHAVWLFLHALPTVEIQMDVIGFGTWRRWRRVLWPLRLPASFCSVHRVPFWPSGRFGGRVRVRAQLVSFLLFIDRGLSPALCRRLGWAKCYRQSVVAARGRHCRR